MDDADAMVAAYLRDWPAEAERVARLRGFLARHRGPARIARSNFDGHLTASAFIVNAARDAMLLVRHRKLGRWLQPGGHIDAKDRDLVAAALREAGEETAIPAAALQWATRENGETRQPLDLDSHDIPANTTKGEAAHIHHDFRYLFVHAGPDAAVTACATETEGCRWVPLDELASDAEFGRVVVKVWAELAKE